MCTSYTLDHEPSNPFSSTAQARILIRVAELPLAGSILPSVFKLICQLDELRTAGIPHQLAAVVSVVQQLVFVVRIPEALSVAFTTVNPYVFATVVVSVHEYVSVALSYVAICRNTLFTAVLSVALPVTATLPLRVTYSTSES